MDSEPSRKWGFGCPLSNKGTGTVRSGHTFCFRRWHSVQEMTVRRLFRDGFGCDALIVGESSWFIVVDGEQQIVSALSLFIFFVQAKMKLGCCIPRILFWYRANV